MPAVTFQGIGPNSEKQDGSCRPFCFEKYKNAQIIPRSCPELASDVEVVALATVSGPVGLEVISGDRKLWPW